MTDQAIQQQMDALRKVTEKALQSKATARQLLADLVKFSTSPKVIQSSTSFKKAK